MVYGERDGYLVYGFCEVDPYRRMARKVYEPFGLSSFWKRICIDEKQNARGAIYGVLAKVTRKGEVKIGPKARACAELMYKRIPQEHKDQYSPLGFYMGVSGDCAEPEADYSFDIDSSDVDNSGDDDEYQYDQSDFQEDQEEIEEKRAAAAAAAKETPTTTTTTTDATAATAAAAEGEQN